MLCSIDGRLNGSTITSQRIVAAVKNVNQVEDIATNLVFIQYPKSFLDYHPYLNTRKYFLVCGIILELVISLSSLPLTCFSMWPCLLACKQG